MPKIMFDGTAYGLGGGKGNANVVEMTQAEYDALPNPDPETIYFITDANAPADVGETDISDIGDGTITGAIGALNSKKPVDLTKSYLHSCSAANQYELITTVTIPAKSFYTFTARTGYNNAQPSGVRICYANNYLATEALQEPFGGNVDYHQLSCAYSGYAHSDVTFYIFGRWRDRDLSASCWILGFYIPA